MLVGEPVRLCERRVGPDTGDLVLVPLDRAPTLLNLSLLVWNQGHLPTFSLSGLFRRPKCIWSPCFSLYREGKGGNLVSPWPQPQLAATGAIRVTALFLCPTRWFTRRSFNSPSNPVRPACFACPATGLDVRERLRRFADPTKATGAEPGTKPTLEPTLLAIAIGPGSYCSVYVSLLPAHVKILPVVPATHSITLIRQTNHP